MTSNVHCGYSGASWELNSSGQDACQVYAQLQGQCNSTFVISQLTSSSLPYAAPSNACGCNVVAYNLMAGCMWCQNEIPYSGWLSVAQWETSCTTYNASGIPTSVSTTGINVPSWAFDIPTGTTWDPAEAFNAAVPNGFTSTTTRRPLPTDSPDQITSEGIALGRVVSAVVIISIMLWCFIGISILCCIVSCIAHCQRQTRRRRWYEPMSTHYLRQRAMLYYGPYPANTNPGAVDSTDHLLHHPNQLQPPPSAHVHTRAFSPLRTSFIRSTQPLPAEMTHAGSTPLAQAEPVGVPAADLDPVPYSPVSLGRFGEPHDSPRGTGGGVVDDAHEIVDVRRTKNMPYGGNGAVEAGHSVEYPPQSLLPYAHGQEKVLTEGKGKQEASCLAV